MDRTNSKARTRLEINKLKASMPVDEFGCCKRLYWNQMIKEEIKDRLKLLR